MSRVWFDQPLETVALFWRVWRRDGVTLGFTTHDRDLWFGGIRHRAAPGMIPSAIRRTADFQPDSAEVEGALSHAALSAGDLARGRFDRAAVQIGMVDWETLDHEVLYRGTIGSVAEEGGRFTASLHSRKADLAIDPVPRTSPTCRAEFCGPDCGLSPARFTQEAAIAGFAEADNAVTLAALIPLEPYRGGSLRWLDGPHAGLTQRIVRLAGAEALVLDSPLDLAPPTGARVRLREGCDRTLATCAARFANAVNFRGEPFLPGNDLVTRYPAPPA